MAVFWKDLTDVVLEKKRQQLSEAQGRILHFGFDLALPRATSQPKALQRGQLAMGKAMKAMKLAKKKIKETETSSAKGQGLAKGPGILKRPSSILKLP